MEIILEAKPWPFNRGISAPPAAQEARQKPWKNKLEIEKNKEKSRTSKLEISVHARFQDF